MKKYVIFVKKGETNREYLYQLTRSSVYTQDDIGHAIEFNSEEEAFMVKDYIAKRENNKDFYVLSISTEYLVLGE